ncbi:MAG: site-2 protease family protein [Oscillospiraceae bacterium]|nr:site-2 protease family protein [Oscillospiraceae bacterium]
MSSLHEFAAHMDWWGLLSLLISGCAALLCITIHELAHGLMACRLGDPTAKEAKRLTLNPIRHIDPIGLLMMLVAKVGWAKPVPVDMRYFRRPKRDMALTALAGPASNFLLALIALALCSLIGYFAPFNLAVLLLLCFLSHVALLSVGLGIFNLIPISPLDGSKVLLALLPDKIYYMILRYERYAMLLLVLLTILGVFQHPLSVLIFGVLKNLCHLTRFPLPAVLAYQDISYLLSLTGLG